MEGTYHRRILPPPAVAFNSPEGRELFNEALHDKTLESYFSLAEHYITQGNLII